MGMLQIDVLGTSFTIQAKEDSQYLESLLDYYKRIVTKVENSGIQDSLRLSIIAGILLCDELYTEKTKNIENSRNKSETELAEAEKITLKMIDNIDRALS